MVSYCKPSSFLFLATATSVTSAHKIPDDFDVEKFAAELKQLRIDAGQYGIGNNGVASTRQFPNGSESEKFPANLKKLPFKKSKGGDSKAMKGDAGPTRSPLADTFLDGNEFIPPNCEREGLKCRGPCPFINVMANHGYINRNGLDIPVFDIPALAPVLFDFPKEMFTRPANQAVFDGQVDVQEGGEALLDIVRLWDRPGEERDISQVFPNPGIMWMDEDLDNTYPDTSEFPVGQMELFTEFRYTVDHVLLQQLLALSEDGVTMTQAQHNQHLHHRLQESLQDDDFFRLSDDDVEVASTQYVLPCIILGQDVEDFSFCDKASIEALWTEFRFVDGFAPRSVIFGDAFDPPHYLAQFTEFMMTNGEDIEEALEEEQMKKKQAKVALKKERARGAVA